MEMLWFWLVAVMVAIYAVMDGFDFGAGTLHLFVAKTEDERREVLAAIGPWWDGNEVWLLAAGGSMFMAFPRLLASSFSGFYLALFLVIWCLALRGIGIEFRSHVRDGLWRAFWDGTFALASTLMPILLGAALGNVVRGVPMDGSGWFQLPLFTNFGVVNPVGLLDWYTVLMGVLVLATLAAHGGLFLVWKTAGAVQARARAAAQVLWLAVGILTVAATFATAFVNPAIPAHLPHAPLAWAGIALFLGGYAGVFLALRRERPFLALAGSSLFIVGILVATAASVWPVMLRSTLGPAFDLTAQNSCASAYGLKAGLKWWLVGFPLVVLYFSCLARVHRGKVVAPAEGEGY